MTKHTHTIRAATITVTQAAPPQHHRREPRRGSAACLHRPVMRLTLGSIPAAAPETADAATGRDAHMTKLLLPRAWRLRCLSRIILRYHHRKLSVSAAECWCEHGWYVLCAQSNARLCVCSKLPLNRFQRKESLVKCQVVVSIENKPQYRLSQISPRCSPTGQSGSV